MGEILIGGPTLSLGYFRDDEATRKRLSKSTCRTVTGRAFTVPVISAWNSTMESIGS